MLETVIENDGLAWLVVEVLIRETHGVIPPVHTHKPTAHSDFSLRHVTKKNRALRLTWWESEASSRLRTHPE